MHLLLAKYKVKQIFGREIDDRTKIDRLTVLKQHGLYQVILAALLFLLSDYTFEPKQIISITWLVEDCSPMIYSRMV